MSLAADYYKLTKPGIVRGNALHVIAGALFASFITVDFTALLAVLIGTSLIIASACVANNYMDRGIDAKMARTQKRPSVTGSVSLRNAMVFAAVLLAAGFGILYVWTNLIVMAIGVIAYLTYVFAYGWAKRNTIHSTIVGAVPGALPALAGYVAITNELSLSAWLIFLLIFVWQMPHFYAISVFRKKEYAAAGIPVLGVVSGFSVVRLYILAYLVLYLLVITALIYFQTVGAAAGLLLLAAAAYWMIVFWRTKTPDQTRWARSVFGASLVVTLLTLVASVVNVFVPPLQ